MRTVLGATLGAVSCAGILLAGLVVTPDARADSTYYQNNAQFGMTLPQASLPNGQDEIRTADGTSCRSAVGGDGAYFDMGVIGTPGGSDIDASSAGYGRIVIPLGTKSTRLDCTQLYGLEISRLKMELELARMGAAGGVTAPAQGGDGGWDDEGWSNTAPAAPTADATGSETSSGAEVTIPIDKQASTAKPAPAVKPVVKTAAKPKQVQKAKVIPVSSAPEQMPKPRQKKSLLGVMFPAPVIETSGGLY